ncbi:2Fe-2S iron-sulfur cluster-binding protein [Alphaproteobacteria bacterium]|nr:2Fe-2S iron-sulfur cluster-binding protein [Alphaproteobacteria bacterium]
MPKLIFVNSEGTEKFVEAENGLSVMEIARDNDLEIEGTCGGSISCCTCHVIIDKDWFSVVGGPNPDEEDMLDLAVGLQPTSRLSCQIEVTNELDGLRMTIPEE